MNNSYLILEHNTSIISNIQMKKRSCTIRCHAKRLTASSLLHIVSSVNGIIQKYDHIKPLIELDLSHVIMSDKLVYILLENLCYAIIKDMQFPVRLQLYRQAMIQASGFKYSPLHLLNSSNSKKCCQQFIEYYEQNLIFRPAHYRRIVSKDERADSDIFCTIMSDIRSFLKRFYGDLNRIEEISEVVAELCGNAWEHSQSDCLIDLDAANDFMKADRSDSFMYGCINIVILNLSPQLIGDDLRNKVLTTHSLDSRYQTLRDAYNFHKNHFSDSYSEDAFWGIAAFQDKISGRPGFGLTGGTGLPQTVRSMEKGFADLHCYCCSGNSFIRFIPNALEYNKDGWIGFNENGEFLNKIPMNGVVGHNDFYLPGTGFNLTFVFKRSEV